MRNSENQTRGRRWPWVVTLGFGIGLVLAPVAFQMFARAPKGGDMIASFRPYMTERKITGFQGDMREINAAVVEARARFDPALARRFPLYTDFNRNWNGIDADMNNMLGTMRRDLPDFAAVDALPPFRLFPWFFVAPGVSIAVVSLWGLARAQRGGRTTAPVVLLVVLGVGLVAAPVVFEMFTRAPKGGAMIDDFRPLMTSTKVQTIQGYFLVIGSGEGTIRNEVIPALAKQTAVSNAALRAALPALSRFSTDWPNISNQMAPMIGAMSDNLGNYAAVDALPPFPLFPWFFGVPGVLVIGLALAAGRRRAPFTPTNLAASTAVTTK